MNILFINEYDWFKGVVFDIHVFADGLSLLGHRIYAIDSEWGGGRLRLGTKEVNDVARVYPGAKVDLSRPGFVNLPGLGLFSTLLSHYAEIDKVIKTRNIDVIVLYSVLTNGLASVHLARKFNIPVVFRCIDALHNLTPNPMVRRIVNVLEKRVYSKVDSVLAVSPGYAEYVKSMGAPESRVKLLLFPMDTELFRPSVDSSEVRQKWGLGEKDQVIVFMGTLFQFGGLGGFIRQFPEVIKQVPEAKLLIVGDGPRRPELERIIAELGLREHVIITGFQPFQTMPQYINLAILCINPFPISGTTRYIFSGKIIQYLACGKVVVASPVPGMISLIPGESGGVVYADTVADMAREMVLLLKSIERRERLGQAGLNYVRQAHDREKLTRQLEAYLAEAIKEKRSSTSPKRLSGAKGK